MLSSITADDVYSQILLLRDTDNRTLLLLEGDTDCSTIDAHLSDSCASLPAYSKDAAIGAARLAHFRGDRRVLALVDRDWAGVIEDSAPGPNVFFTDAYDMEATLFCIDDLRTRVIHAASNRRPSQTVVREIVELTVSSAAAIAALRFASQDNGWFIGVRGFPVHEIVDLGECKIDVYRMCVIALAKSRSPVDIRVVLTEVEWLRSVLADAAFCSGHDLMKALSFMIRRLLGGSIGEEHLAAMFRAALNFELLSDTDFFRTIQLWAERGGQEVWRRRRDGA
jgi:hypothetical protein